MFIAGLCKIAKTWKQPKCPSIEEWIKKMWYTHAHAHAHTHIHTHTHTHTMEYYSATKKNTICSNMEKPKDCHTE